jgi:hypothetical protein
MSPHKYEQVTTKSQNAHFMQNQQKCQYFEFGTQNTTETIKVAEESGYRKGKLLPGDVFKVKQIIKKGRIQSANVHDLEGI